MYLVFGLAVAAMVAIVALTWRRAGSGAQNLLWGGWAVGAALALLSIGVHGYAAAQLLLRGMRPSLTGLERLAALQVLAVLALTLLLLAGTFWSMKKRWPAQIRWASLGIGALAAAVIIYAGMWSTAKVVTQTRQERLEEWTMTVRDEDERPVVGATVNCRMFGYGPGGTRPQNPVRIEGPMTTDAIGQVVIHGWPGRYEVLGMVERTGFAPMQFEIGMAFEGRDERTFTLNPTSLRTLPLAYGQLPATGPFAFAVYLPSDAVARARVERRRIAWYFNEGKDRARDMALWIAADGTPQRMRLWMDHEKDQWGYDRPRLHLAGLDGLEFFVVPAGPSADTQKARASHFLHVAPEEGYVPEILATGKDITIFARSRSGGFARIEAYGVRFEQGRSRAEYPGIFEALVFWNVELGRGLYGGNGEYQTPRVE